MDRRQLSRGQQALVVIVVLGTVVISLIGFVGSYDAVLRLAQRNGFGWFSYLLPIGIDVGITVFLALDLLLTWMRIPLPILRQLAWLLTGATIVFNAASAWPNPLASGMHGVVPLLFVAAIEAARHTVGRLAQIEANQLFERTRLGRWVFAPIATMRLFRRRVLWELRSYEEALEHERRRLVYRARLRAVYGRLWRFKAPVDFILLLKLANLGEPLPEFKLDAVPALPGTMAVTAAPSPDGAVKALLPQPREEQPAEPADTVSTGQSDSASPPSPAKAEPPAPTTPSAEPDDPDAEASATAQNAEAATPSSPELAAGQDDAELAQAAQPALPLQTAPDASPALPVEPSAPTPVAPAVRPAVVPGTAVDRFRLAFNDYTHSHGSFPDGDQLSKWCYEKYGITGRSGEALSPGHLRRYLPSFKEAWEAGQRAAVGTAQ